MPTMIRVRKCAPPAREVVRTGKVLTFLVGTERYGLSISPILQVLREPAVVRVPGADGVADEVFEFRGEVVRIVDLREAMGAGPGEPVAHLIVVREPVGGGRLALRVNRVGMVHDVPDSDVEPLPAGSHGGRFVSAVARMRDGLVPLLDVAALARHSAAVQTECEAVRPETITVSSLDRRPVLGAMVGVT